MPKNLIYIGAFGIAGVYSRYALGSLIIRFMPSPFPYGTFLVNILGSFCIGIVYVLGVEKQILSEDLRLGLMVGFLGGFTTFSAYSLEAVGLLEEAKYSTALVYLGISPALGLLSAVAGIFLSRSVF